MCGIVTIFSYHNAAPAVDQGELLRVRDRMLLRGPDGAGEWYSSDKRVALGHRRLAIIDLSENGAQPMRNRDNSLVITFNGEIYNYRELRTGLEKKGFQFRSTSDTEVLLNLYADKGQGMVHELRGMYAFAIWDAREKGLFLARDPFGIKPLYYADDGKTFRAASQVKALLAGGAIDTAPEPAGHVGFFLWGHVPEPYTLYKAIRSLPAGAGLWVDERGARGPNTFCSISQELAEASINPPVMTREEMQAQLREALLDSVRHHLIADVPVAVFLSSGMDSTTLAALAAEAGGNLKTVTLGFDEFRGTEHDEVPLAELTAKKYGARHQTIWVKKADFISERGKLMEAMDQPSTDGVNTYFVSLAAAKAGMKVAISGLGGDELFGSYPSFGQLPRMVNAFKSFNNVPALGKALRSLSSPLLKTITSPKYAGLVEYGGSWGGAYMLRRGMFMPWEMEKLLDEDMVRDGLKELKSLERLEETVGHIPNDYLKVSSLELSWYMRNQLLRDTDWASMAHSLEVRVPFLDLKLLRSVAPMLCTNNRPDKRALASTPSNPLPMAVLKRRKTGFTVPVRDWIQGDSRDTPTRGLRGWAEKVYLGNTVNDPSLLLAQKRTSGTVSKRPIILVFRIGQLGDTLVAMPAMNAIKRKHPNHRLILLTDRHKGKVGFVSSWDILGPTDWFDEVVFYNPSVSIVDSLKNGRRIIQRLRPNKIERIYDLSPERNRRQINRDRFFYKHLLGIQNYVGHGAVTFPKRNLDRSLPRVKPEWLRLLQIVSADEGGFDFQLPIPRKFRDEAIRIIAVNGISERLKLIAFGPGSKMPGKRWSRGKFAELGRSLLSRYPDVMLVVLGGAEDAAIGDELCTIWGARSYNLAGKLSVYGSAGVLERSVLYVGNDTGTMHLAAMVGTPCVAIFSSRDYPGKWEPYGENHIVIRTNVDCEGCMLESCIPNTCLKLVTTDAVIKGVVALINQRMNDSHIICQ